MAKSRPEPAAEGGYFAWSRDPAVGLFAVLPLWLCYEGLRLWLTPAERNGAELLLLDALGLLGQRGAILLRILFAGCVAVAAWSLLRREIPWLRVALVSALEGTVYGLLLGPLAGALATSAARVLTAAPNRPGLVPDLVGAMGAGIFEELVFRFGLMSLLAWLWLRTAKAHRLPRWVGGLVTVVVSALLFSWFHHLWGEPYTASAFLFRTMAGLLLGALMLARGYGVCVYTHAMYDVHYYLTTS